MLKRVALRPGKPLERRASLKPGKSPERRKGLAPVSAKKLAARHHEARVRRAVIKRDGGCVLRFGQWARFPRCAGPLTFGHLRNASQGGAFSEANGACLCALHNCESENWPLEAVALGIKIMDKPTGPGALMPSTGGWRKVVPL